MERPVTKSYILGTYEEIAENVEEQRQTPWADIVEFERTLPRGQVILDLGCGTGRNMVHLAQKGHKVVGLDFSWRLLGLAADRSARGATAIRTALVRADVVSIPFKDSSVDSCIYIATLHHLPTKEERLQSLLEMARCLRPGGRALISVWAMEQKRFRKRLDEGLVGQTATGDLYIPIRTRSGDSIQRFYHLFAEDELPHLVVEAGLETMRYFKSHDNYFAVAVKSNGAR